MTRSQPHGDGKDGTGGAGGVRGHGEDSEGSEGCVTVWTITVPAPCLLINLNSRMHWAQKAKLTKAWRTAAHVAARNADLPKGLDRIHILAHVIKPTNRAYDVHNLMPTLKAAIDGLADYGLIPDDTNAHLTGPDLRQGGKGELGVIITITEDLE